MKVRRWLVLLLTLAVVAVACAGEENDTTTTAIVQGSSTTSSGGDTTTVASSTTSSSTTGSTILEQPTGECFFLDGYVAVEQDGLDGNAGAVAALDAEGVTATPVSTAAVLGEDSAAIGVLDEAIDLLFVESENALAAAQVLVLDNDINAGPVYATGLAGHWSLKPGTDPILRPLATIPEPVGELGSGIVAVVDSGLAEPLPQGWMSHAHVLYDSTRDTESIGQGASLASHGTFVTSLIRQQAPEQTVAFARVRPVTVEEILGNNDELPDGLDYFSTELHVAEAIVRLIQNTELNAENVFALNLSLGAYTCAPGDDPTLVTTAAALNLWFGAFPFSTVFAAGGNEIHEAPFWPAAMSIYPYAGIDPDRVRGVGAIDGTGAQVVWSPPTALGAASLPKAPLPRPWVNNVAPGCDLLGLRGGSETDVVAWSGSSFATAVSAAVYSKNFDPSNPSLPADQDYSAANLMSDLTLGCDGTP